MDDREREHLFYEHVDQLHKTAVVEYKSLLEQAIQRTSTEDMTETQMATESFEQAEELLAMDPSAVQPDRTIKSICN